MGVWQRLRNAADERDRRWIEGRSRPNTGRSYLSGLVLLGIALAVPALALNWLRGADLFAGSSGGDEFARMVLVPVAELILLVVTGLAAVAFVVWALIGWRRSD